MPMHRRHLMGLLALCTLPAMPQALPPAPPSAAAPASNAKEAVTAAERAFAATMARRDLRAFAEFVSDEAIFFTGPTPLRGRAAVVEGWARFFAEPAAPFSWEPDEVEVLASGTLAHSSGPVRDPAGKVVARFNSIWRLEAPGRWRVIFDKGSPLPPPRP